MAEAAVQRLGEGPAAEEAVRVAEAEEAVPLLQAPGAPPTRRSWPEEEEGVVEGVVVVALRRSTRTRRAAAEAAEAAPTRGPAAAAARAPRAVPRPRALGAAPRLAAEAAAAHPWSRGLPCCCNHAGARTASSRR